MQFGLKRTAGLIEEGMYPFQITEVEVKEGQEYPYAAFVAECRSQDFDGQKVWFNISSSPKSRFVVEQFLDALGLDDTDDTVEVTELIGMRFKAVIEHEIYNSRKYAKIKTFISANEPDDTGEFEAPW